MSEGKKRREQRLDLNLTMTVVAQSMRISVPYLHDLEEGNRRFTDKMKARHDRALHVLAGKEPSAR